MSASRLVRAAGLAVVGVFAAACGNTEGEGAASPGTTVTVTSTAASSPGSPTDQPRPDVPAQSEERAAGHRSALQVGLRNAATAVESWAVDSGGSYRGLTTKKLYGRAGFSGAPGTQVIVATDPPVTSDGYCLEATHDELPGEPWRYLRGVDFEPVQLSCR